MKNQRSIPRIEVDAEGLSNVLSDSRSQWPRGLRRGSTAARLLGLRIRIPPGAWMSVFCDCCVFSSRGLCVRVFTCPGESYGVLCMSLIVIVKPR